MSVPPPPHFADAEGPGARRARILVVDDEAAMAEGLKALLEKEGHRVDVAGSAAEALARLEESGYALLLSDVRMPGASGLDLLDEAQRIEPRMPVVLLTGYATVPNAVEAIRRGAFDYIAKPFSLDEVRLTVRRALERRSLVEEVSYLRRAVVARGSFGDIVAGPVLSGVLDLAMRVAPAPSSVLLTGETGTGKELVARAIHHGSPRARRPFLAVSCAALAPGLVESELFGHARGAFTGASEARAGFFEVADGGTLFLDEIGDVPPHIQVKLLRVLQDGTFQRVGETRTRTAEVRLIAATHRDLEQEMRAGRFREDLFYRLAVVQIELPALRDRRDDIPALARHFLARYARDIGKPVRTIPPHVMTRLVHHSWPGNVRELENAIERGVLLAEGTALAEQAVPAPRPSASPGPGGATGGLGTLADREKEHIQRVLAATANSKNQAARILGITRRSLYRKLLKHGIPYGGPAPAR